MINLVRFYPPFTHTESESNAQAVCARNTHTHTLITALDSQSARCRVRAAKKSIEFIIVPLNLGAITAPLAQLVELTVHFVRVPDASRARFIGCTLRGATWRGSSAAGGGGGLTGAAALHLAATAPVRQKPWQQKRTTVFGLC